MNPFFDENDIRTLKWPPFSPDVNPIENLWAILKSKIREKSYRTKDEFMEEIHRLWNNDPQLSSHCLRLSDSMPNRVRQCIHSHGAAVNY